MLAYRFNSTLFTHVIAALSLDDATQIAAQNNLFTFSECRIEQWQVPDAWTRRAVDRATSPGVIDTIPRFVVDRKDGPVYLDIEYISEALTPDELAKCGEDSLAHLEWICACHAETHRGDLLRAYVARMVGVTNDDDYATMARALAGAWGLGPIPEWHAAVLPALIALDIEAPNRGYALADNVFELDRDQLWQHLHAQLPETDDDINHLVELIACGTNLSLREYTLRTLVSLGWLR